MEESASQKFPVLVSHIKNTFAYRVPSLYANDAQFTACFVPPPYFRAFNSSSLLHNYASFILSFIAARLIHQRKPQNYSLTNLSLSLSRAELQRKVRYNSAIHSLRGKSFRAKFILFLFF